MSDVTLNEAHDEATEQLARVRESFGLKPGQELDTDTIEGMRQADYAKGFKDGQARASDEKGDRDAGQ